ncbi:MAG: hypothetical protein DRQ54_01030 [Gammaproteobacteria bacterium]|nr:MAG: hypothetical protein DRQ54_01030 [Gammaproteobacteria bacterium]
MKLNRVNSPRHQQGVVLIIMFTILIIAGMALVISGLNQGSSRLKNQRQTSEALAKAKATLLSRAIYLGYKDNNDPGYYSLPCPDRSVNPIAEGGADSSCGGAHATTIGRLPWRSLGLPPIFDGNGECLWYVLAGNHNNSKINNNNTLFNRDTNGQLEIRNIANQILAGDQPENRAIAAIIAPGDAIPGQSRNALSSGVDHCGGNYNASNYLDTANGINNATPSAVANAVTKLVTTHKPEESFNDQIIWITRQELADAFTERATYPDKNGRTFNDKIDNLMVGVAACLKTYADADPQGLHRLPWAAPIALNNYSQERDYDDQSNTHFGRLPYSTAASRIDSGGNLLSELFLGCITPNSEIENYHRNWKDHLFYVVAGSHTPDQTPPPNCSTGNCLTANGNSGQQYAAIILFAERRVSGNTRNAPQPSSDTDTKRLLSSYLEGVNATNFPDAGGSGDYQTTGGTGFNDRLYCISSSDLIMGNPMINRCP